MQIVDDGPSDILHSASDGQNQGKVASGHLNQLSKADHQSCGGHNGDYRHQNFAQLLEKIKVNGEFMRLLLLCCNAGRSFWGFGGRGRRGSSRCFGSFGLRSGRILVISGLVFKGQQHILSSGYMVLNSRHFTAFHSGAYQNRRDGVDSLSLQSFQVRFSDEITGFYLIAGLYVTAEEFSL